MFEAYFDKWSLYMVEKNAEKIICERRNQNYKSAKIIMRKVVNLQLWGFSFMTFQHGGIEAFVSIAGIEEKWLFYQKRKEKN